MLYCELNAYGIIKIIFFLLTTFIDIITMTDLSKINLNLLLALNALLNHCHVTQAANSFNISQAAMSASLKQLREIYQDELLVRGQKSQMTLTPLAESLQIPVRLALDNIQKIFHNPSEFNPDISSRVFHIGMSDYIAFVIMPKLMSYLNKHAPNIQIVQYTINHIDSLAPFENEAIDLVFGNSKEAPDNLISQTLFSDEGVIVADRNHPIMKNDDITIDSIADYPQIFVSIEGKPRKNFIYEYLLEQGLKPTVSLFTSQTLIALQTLAGTNFITHSVTRLAKPLLQSHQLAMREVPYKHFPKYEAKQYWHEKMQNDSGHYWLRNTIKVICNKHEA